MITVPVDRTPPLRALPDLIEAVLTGSGHPLGTRSIRRRLNRMLTELHDGVGSPWRVSSGTVAGALDRDRGRRFLRIDEFTWRLLEDELAEMASAWLPWDADRAAGEVRLEGLAQTAGRRAMLREAFTMLVDAVRAIEPAVARSLERVARQVDERSAERLSEDAHLMGRAPDEPSEADPAMRTLVRLTGGAGEAAAEPVPEVPARAAPAPPEVNGHGHTASPSALDQPGWQRFRPEVTPPPPAGWRLRRRSQPLPPLLPDPAPGRARSRFDAKARVVLYNDRHPDYLLVKDDEPALLDYLAALAAKEYVVDSDPRASGNQVGEEMVRVLVRMRHRPSTRR
jgi:hypothetical protein